MKAMSEASTFVYVSYIRTSADKLWAMLTTPDFIKEFWFGTTAESDFRTGSPWKLIGADGRVTDTGEILEAIPPRRLIIKWRNEFRPDLKAEGYSRCTMEIEPADGAVKLTITHAMEAPGSKFIEAVSGGWPKIISNLKSLLETDQPAFAAPN
jgi:uncharacterized protein YndB with AHSA1/START domain